LYCNKSAAPDRQWHEQARREIDGPESQKLLIELLWSDGKQSSLTPVDPDFFAMHNPSFVGFKRNLDAANSDR
jgi:hypothetical protein